MAIALSTESMVALIVCALAGAIAYTVFYAISKYEKQKADAAIILDAVALSGRDPTDLSQLTTKEKWEVTKAQHFDRIFIVADVLAVLIGAGLAIGFMLLFGPSYVSDEAAKYGILGFIAAILATLVVNETLVKAAAQGLWEKKSAEAFRIVTSAVEDVVEANGGLEELIEKYIAKGFTKREAKKLAKEYLAEHIDD